MQLSKEIIEILQKITENRECTKADIAEFCGVSRSMIGHVISGRREPKKGLYNKILAFIEKHNNDKLEMKEREESIISQATI